MSQIDSTGFSQDRYVPKGMGRTEDPIYGPRFVRGSGIHLWDDLGRQYIDCTTGYSALNFGHCHPTLVAVATEQLSILTHLTGQRHPWREELCCELSSAMPHLAPAKAWIATTGARAVEVAWKIAWQRRPGVLLRFTNAYHGRSITTSRLTATKSLPIVELNDGPALPYPDCSVCPYGLHPTRCQVECFEPVREHVEFVAHKASAIIVEPALGARGYLFPPVVFFQRLRNLADSLGLLVISDEIQMGMGRLGHVSASAVQGWKPDLVVLGKSLGGGLVPISAVIGRAELIDSLPSGVESETFAASPLACRIAIASLSMLKAGSPSLNVRADVVGQRLRQGVMRVLQNGWRDDSDTLWLEGQGASAAVEMFPRNALVGERLAWQVTRHAMELGLLLHHSGPRRNRVVFIPPLTILDNQIDDVIEGFERALIQTISCQKIESLSPEKD